MFTRTLLGEQWSSSLTYRYLWSRLYFFILLVFPSRLAPRTFWWALRSSRTWLCRLSELLWPSALPYYTRSAVSRSNRIDRGVQPWPCWPNYFYSSWFPGGDRCCDHSRLSFWSAPQTPQAPAPYSFPNFLLAVCWDPKNWQSSSVICLYF